MPDAFCVVWRNPVTGLRRRVTFDTRADAEAYVEGRDRKYGRFSLYVRPSVEDRRGSGAGSETGAVDRRDV